MTAGPPHLPDFACCFGCGQPRGLRLRVLDPRTGQLAEFTPGPEHQGAPGRTHGGILAAALDEAIGIAVWRLDGEFVTARLETDYLRPVPTGTTLTIRTRLTGVSGRKVHARAGGLLGPDGPVAVRASALYVEVSGRQLAQESPR